MNVNIKEKISNWKKIDLTSWHPILIGCLLVWFLSCNKACAGFITEQKNSIAVFLFVGYLVLMMYAVLRKSNIRTVLGFIFLGGFLLRAYYVLAAPYNISLHDVFSFVGFDSEEVGAGHFGYIEYLFKNHCLPDFDPREKWSFYQPPLFYIVSAAVLQITRLFRIEAPLCYESIQTVTLFFSSLTVWTGYRILKECSVSGRWILIFSAFLSVHPFFGIMSVTLTNDCIAMYFMLLAIWYTIRWYKKPQQKNIVVIAFAVGLAMASKINAAVISFGIGMVFLYVFWMNRQRWKDFIIQFTVFLAVCAPIGLYYPVRNLLKFHMPLAYVQSLSSDSLLTGATIFSRIGLPSWKELSHAFISFDRSAEHNIWIGALRTSLFDELMPDAEGSLFAASALALFWISIVLAVTMNIAWIRSFSGNSSVKGVIRAFLAVEYLVMIISYVYFCFKEPCIPTMNYRYIPITLFFPVFGTALWFRQHQKAGDGNRTPEQETGRKTTYPVLGQVLLCGLLVFGVLALVVDFNLISCAGNIPL